jgi:hypothetical protein
MPKWQKGQSGNPAGHSKARRQFMLKQQELAIVMSDPLSDEEDVKRSFAMLRAMRDNPSTPPAVKATVIAMLLDRQLGKPIQHTSVDLSHDREQNLELATDDELNRIALTGVAAEPNGGAAAPETESDTPKPN